MKIITVKEHFTDKRIMDANNIFNKNQPSMTPEQTETMIFLISRALPGEELLDIEKDCISFMDANKIDMQVLSYTSPVSDLVPFKDAVMICKQANNILAGRISEHPTRFAGFATLPMASPKVAAQELERCVRDYHFCGVLLAGRYQGRFYNEEEFFPIF
ncbi:amidohydrolase family protein [Listeria monocytogenes]|nr:amidohydrolase family protein [Listeria monocytogenes]